MTKTMTALEAHEQFFDVLDDAQNGAEVIIERDNHPIARLSPVPKPQIMGEALAKQRLEAIERLRQWAKESVIGPPLTIEEIISARDEDRRF